MKKFFRILTAPWRWLIAPFHWMREGLGTVSDFFTEVPEDVSLTETIGGALEGGDSFKDTLQGVGEHIMALRMHLFRSVVALAITTTFSFLFAQNLMEALARPLPHGLLDLQVIEPTEAVSVFMRVALLSGVAFAMPWIVLELYLFIAPGLMPRSRVLLLLAIPAASLLFLAGLAFTYFVMLPAAVPFLLNFMGFRAAWRPSAYFNLITGLMFWIGIFFQMPLIIYVLAAVGLIRAKQLAEQWRIAIVAIAVIAAAVTPTVDPVNMALVMLPMILLYFFSILGAVVAQAGRERSQQSSAAD